ncbi:hypothetical protein PR202_ga09472 [Eleusine coracana subsp. coracana]|uniref:MATH domain-containing protein n=1 Tax=Eleusine coracana subsp. coracana TaxID=191504 RepID=A0AAV5C515_ELECO|nr:hypothetical protein PR202_ga09472 [Eleusine coracana subsp. coracana]
MLICAGWSHFAQFTIAVGNLDPKKIKYSDTLHKFWKKEHDWGWKKFMELSKIQDGFLVDDVLEIIAQVQVISFRAFWLAIDPTTRRRMSSEKSETILKIVVKSFFVEKEVTSTLVMDALYTGLKALEHHSKGNKGAVKSMAVEELSTPMVHVDMDMFVLAGDFIALLERAALEPLSCQPQSPKDDKCSQSRAKDGGSGEVNKVSIKREERRLTEIGWKILEIFVLGIEVAYQEAVALKRQEELIREEELLENEMKGKRGDKRAKKKQSKQKKNNRKVKDKERDDRSDSKFPEKGRDGNTDNGMEDSKQAGQLAKKVKNSEECASDVSDNLNGSAEVCQTDKNTVPENATNDVGIELESDQTVNKDSTLEIESLKEIEGRELLKAHLEKKAAAEAVIGSTSASSSDSLEKVHQVLKCPEQSSVTIPGADINAPPPKAVPIGTSDASNGTVPAPVPTTISTKSVPIVTTTPSQLECNNDVSNSRQKNDRAMPSRSLLVDKAVPTPPKSPLPQVDTVAKAAPATPKPSSSQIDKVAKATPAPLKPSAPQIDKIVHHNSVSRQISSATVSKAQEDTIPERVAITSIPRTPTPTSRPSSAPLFQAPRSTAYRIAVLGMASMDTSSASLGQSTSKLQSVAVSQPLSTYASAASVMMPPVERNGQLSGKQGFMSGLSNSEALDNWHPWKGNSDVNRQMWRDDTPNQQMTNQDSRAHTWKDISYQQVSSSGPEHGRFDGMQYRQFQREIPVNSVSYQQPGPVVEEFPHLDIINDLLDEEQDSGGMTGSPLHEYPAFELPFASNGTVTDSEMASSTRLQLTSPVARSET